MTRGNKLDKVLTGVFMILTIIAITCYFVYPDNLKPFLYSGCVAISFRLFQYLMRYIS